MRDIIFRAKAVSTNEWVYGSLIKKPVEDWIEYSIIDEDGDTSIIHEETIGQYICRKDINGKKIFEGDITNHGVVEYNTDLHWDGGGSKHPGFYFRGAYDCLGDGAELSYHTKFDDCEVLGNICENPELLEKEK